MKKFVLLLGLFMVFGLVGCTQETTADPNASTTEEAVTMQMTWWSDGTEGDVMQGLLDDYFTETGVTIELVEVAYNDYEATLATNIAGDAAPALARMTEGHLNNLQDNILSLDSTITAANFTNLFYNEAGNVIALPMDITANGLFVNLDLCDANGVNLPTVDDVWTWDEFHTEMMKLDGATGVAAPGIFDHQGHRFMPLIYQTGNTIWDEAYTTSNLTDAAVVAQVQMIQDWYEDGFLPRDTYTTKNSASLFRTGQYGFHLSGNWNVSNYQDLEFDWTVVPMPQDANRATILGGKSLAALEGSGYEEEAKAFIAWMAEAEQHDAYTGGVPYLTPRLGAEVDYGDFTAEYNVFLSEISATDQAYVQDWLSQVMIPGMYPIINDFVEKVALGTDTAANLLAQLEADLKAAAAE